MSTDTLTPRDPFAVLCAALIKAMHGAKWSSATWHDEAVLAGLRSGQIVAAQKAAVSLGYLEPIGEWIDGEFCPNMTRATHAAADGRWVALYRRTSLPLPGQAGHERHPDQIDGQLCLVEVTA